ncbi:MAG: hypothetical protein CMO69_03630 [Verrucomicrobiales bacterium]|nr:hypothetical protein [Verrucomicrobiales bacterium]
MKENEIELKIQALVDGELTESEAEQIRECMGNDVRFQILYAQLIQTKDLISKHEMPRILPESGDFYWAKIAQEIGAVEPANQGSNNSLVIKWLFRRLAPLLGIAAIVLLITLQQPSMLDLDIEFESDHELELVDDDIEVMTFNSFDDSMSIVWLDYSMDLQKDYMELWLD